MQLRPDLIVADPSPEAAGTPAILFHLARELPQAWFVLFGDAFSYEELDAFATINVRGCLLWQGLTRTIVYDFFVAILDGGTVSSPAVAATYCRGNQPPPGATNLTSREQEVLALVVRGLSDQEVALQLGLSTGTIPAHVHRIAAKLGARNRSHLCYIAGRRGLV